MAFTQEQIEKALTVSNDTWPKYKPEIEQYEQSVNYKLISDYLTGETDSFPALQKDNQNFLWIHLLDLIKTINPPSADDQKVLDIIRHPILIRKFDHFFMEWLLEFAIVHQDKSSLQGVITQLKMNGFNDDNIFYQFVSYIGFYKRDADIGNTALKQYLIDYIRQFPQLINVRVGPLQWHNSWSIFYFKLLEEANPELATEYAFNGIYSEGNSPVKFFAGYKDGYYMPAILEFIQNRQNHNLQTIQIKFAAALQLYVADAKKYGAIASELAVQYLEYIKLFHAKDKWENTIEMVEFQGTELHFLTFSSCAFHILLQKDRDRALRTLSELFTSKTFVSFNTILVLQYHLGKAAFPYIELEMQADNRGMDHYKLLINFLEKEYDSSEYLPLIWNLAGNKSRPLKDLVTRIVTEKDKDAEAKAIELLESKNPDIRQTAALILTQFNSSSANEAIKRVLNKESNDNARDILLQAVSGTLPEKGDESFVSNMIQAARERGKLNKPIEAWLHEDLLPSLYDYEGKELSKEYVRFLLYRMSRVKDMCSDVEARYILQLIDKERAAAFALELIKIYIDKAAKPENKYLMALASLLGNESVVDKIRITINKWMDENRYKMAEYGVSALALQGSDKALRWVEWYSRKYKTKKANVGAAALEALETAARELGITIHELGDKIVPDFGFDGLFKHFNIGSNEYRAFIDSNFKIAFFNEDNKKLKSLPLAAGTELKEEFKAIAKEVRDIVRSQSSRLEYYLIIQRRWNYEQWQKFFLQNPVMFIYATKLLWGIYDGQGALKQTFLCQEDTTLTDINHDEISIDDNKMIGIVHPSQLDASLLQNWKKQFFDLSIESIFPQLERRLPDMKDIDLSRSIISKFSGKRTVTGSIRSTLEQYGWQKGPTGDGGMLDSFNLLYADGGMEAILEVEGVGAGYGWGDVEKTGRLYVIDKSKLKERWFHPPKNENDERLIQLKDIPTIFFNEMLMAVELIKLVG